jgi:outer membrane lipoprotein-sorting protein
MKPQIRSARFTLSFLISLGVAQAAAAQPSDTPAANPQSRMSVEEIVTNLVQRNLERARALGAYQGTRVYRLEYRGFPGSRSAEMTVDVKYRTPGTKEFSIRSEKGSQLIIERVFKRMLQSEKEAVSEENQSRIALNNDNYRFTLAGYESAPAGSSYILSVEPRTNNKLLYRGRIWVDAEDFAVVRIEAAPAKNPSFWTKETRIEQVYTKVGDFWLPASNRSSSAIRLGGQANFTIDYHDYQITAASPVGAAGKVAGYR